MISCNFQKVSEGEMLVKIQPTTVGILLIYDYLISYFDKYERSRTPDAYIMPRHKWVKVLQGLVSPIFPTLIVIKLTENVLKWLP